MAPGLEDAINALGNFGLYQVVTYLLVGFSFGLTSHWQLFAIIFIGYINDFHCKAGQNMTLEESVPKLEGGYKGHARCEQYAPNSNNATIPCENGYEWRLDGFSEDGTITMEFNLVCDKDSFVELSQTLFNVGVVVGFFGFTPFADKFGRKTMFFVCQFVMSVFGIVMSVSPTFEGFCATQFITGACGAGLYVMGMILAIEAFPVAIRGFVAPATLMFISLGMQTLSLWAYFFRNWRHLQLGISVAGFCALAYFFWCPESLRWLVLNGKEEKAMKQLESAARINKVKLPQGLKLIQEDSPTESRGSLLRKFISNKRTVGYTLIMMYLTFSANLMFYALALMMGAIEGNIYFNFFVTALLDFPGILISQVLMYYFGRRIPMFGMQLFCGVTMGIAAIALVPGVYEAAANSGLNAAWLTTGLAFVPRLGVGAAFGVLLVYSQEIFPTNIRSTGVGVVTGAGYLGSILAPYSIFLYRLYPYIPTAIFAFLMIIAALLTLLLPETIGRNLPESVEEILGWTLALSPEEKKAVEEARQRGLFRRSQAVTPVEVVKQDSSKPDLGSDMKTSDEKVENGLNNPAFVPEVEEKSDTQSIRL